MPSIIHYTNCPVCGSTDILFVFLAKDNTVSKQEFEIWECRACTLRFTQDIPDLSSIGSYYKSTEYISHSNTSRGLINRLYKLVRNRSLLQKRKLIQKTTGLDKGKLLDLGSGIGAFVNEMSHHGWDVTGIEPENDARIVALNLYNITLDDNDDFKKLPENFFDVITLWHVLEHVHELHEYIVLLKKMLKKTGKLFIAVPNYSSLDGKVYKQFWAAYDVPRHLYHFTPKSMDNLMKRHGLKILSQKPMWFDSFYISLLSSKYKDSGVNWVPAILNGMRSNLKAMRNTEKSSSVIYIISK
jgi:SAM-dependent methyltransferase